MTSQFILYDTSYKMSRFYNKIAIFLVIVVLEVNGFKIEQGIGTTPNWVSLCGRNYLFSEDTLDWNSSRKKCELLGKVR